MFTSLSHLERVGLHFQLSIVRTKCIWLYSRVGPQFQCYFRISIQLRLYFWLNSFFGWMDLEYEIQIVRPTNWKVKEKSFFLLLPCRNIGQKHISYYYSTISSMGNPMHIHIFMGVWLCSLCCFTTKSKEKLNEKIDFSTNALSWQHDCNGITRFNVHAGSFIPHPLSKDNRKYLLRCVIKYVIASKSYRREKAGAYLHLHHMLYLNEALNGTESKLMELYMRFLVLSWE